jgi:hypothetical protein
MPDPCDDFTPLELLMCAEAIKFRFLVPDLLNEAAACDLINLWQTELASPLFEND